MKRLQTDLSAFERFEFEKPAIGIKYLLQRPEGIAQLDKQLALCEMIKEAHRRNTPFYFSKENEDCFGKAALGMMEEQKPFGQSGEVGYRWGIFQEPRANSILYNHNYHLGKGMVNYVALSPLDKLNYEPDIIIVMCKTAQAEVILRSVTYSTGEIYESKTGPVFGCSWLFAYPYLTGKVNYVITGLGHGMKGREVFPDGWVLISIPFNWIPTVARNLNEMQWDLPAFTAGRDGFLRERNKMLDDIAEEFRSH
jgi:uncharacterized protein (DUF169 family)